MDSVNFRVRDLIEADVFWQESSDSSVGMLNAAFLPGSVGIAEEGFALKGVEFLMAGKLATIVEGDRFSSAFREDCEA